MKNGGKNKSVAFKTLFSIDVIDSYCYTYDTDTANYVTKRLLHMCCTLYT